MAVIELQSAPKANDNVLTPSISSPTNIPLAPQPWYAPSATLTQKEWVIPPRPKPGRKPAADVPPTKRKAQNREAQRAFRQRRAAKVGELEDQMKQLEDEGVREQAGLREYIQNLEKQVNDYSDTIGEWRLRYENLDRQYAKERQVREEVELELHLLRQGTIRPNEAVPLPSRSANKKTESHSHEQNATWSKNDESMTCGRCSGDTRCQCIDEAFEMSHIATDSSTNIKRTHSPNNTTDSHKRVCQEDNGHHSAFEIDFTTSKPPSLPTQKSTSSSYLAPNVASADAAADSCGFCQDGTPCICAEIYRNEQQQRSQHVHREIEEPQQLPSPQDSSFPSMITSSAPSYTAPSPASCTSNPGTCAQCISDPRSTLFCKSLAASAKNSGGSNRNSSEAIASAEKGPNNNVEKTLPKLGPDPNPQSSPTSNLTLSCADAFTTLSRHPAFPQASTDLGSWVPQLHTRSPAAAVRGTGTGTRTAAADKTIMQGRTAFEIEAASVMGVLKFFDRRFGGNPAGETRAGGAEVEKER